MTCNQQWPVNNPPPQHSRDIVVIGLLLDPEHAQNILDSGPAANSPDVSYVVMICLRARTDSRAGLFKRRLTLTLG